MGKSSIRKTQCVTIVRSTKAASRTVSVYSDGFDLIASIVPTHAGPK